MDFRVRHRPRPTLSGKGGSNNPGRMVALVDADTLTFLYASSYRIGASREPGTGNLPSAERARPTA
jgi:hypothetical protein